MIQPVLLQAFASTPVQVATAQRAGEAASCADCGQTVAPSADQPVDELELSEQALAAAQQAEAASPPPPPREAEEADPNDATSSESDGAEADATAGEEGHGRPVRGEKPPEGEESEAAAASDLTEEEQQQVSELKSRDREVRSHEQAHLAAAGPHATGGPSYEYQEGPDGQRYAVGGEVGIDTSPVSGDPEATIQKAQQIRAAALAPATPSSQDQAVAAAATQMESQARAELSKQNQIPQSAAASYGESEEASLTGALLDLVA